MRRQLWTRLIVATLALSAPALTLAAEPQWQRGRQDDDQYWRGSNREVYERGYREGVQLGRDDARRDRAYNVERNGVYRAGDRGYNRNYGRRDAYRDQFRRGFVEGYRVGYTQVRRVSRGPFGRSDQIGRRVPSGYQEPAYARGYSDGYKKGREDGDNRRYDPVRHGDYRNADNGYRGEYGSKDAYRNNYRSGFRQGYDEGYRDFDRGRGRR